MGDEEAPMNCPRTGNHRDGEIAHDGQMAFGHPEMRPAAAVSRVFPDIVGAHDPRTVEGRREDRRIPRHLEVGEGRSEEHTSELQSLMRISYAVFCLKKKKQTQITNTVSSHTKQKVIVS